MKWIAALILFPTYASAFTLGGADNSLIRGWNNKTLIFHFNPTNCGLDENVMKRAILEAIDLWNGVPGSSITLQLGDNSTTPVAMATANRSQGEPVILCDPTFGTTTGLNSALVTGSGGFALVGDTIAYGYVLLNAEGTAASISVITYRLMTIAIAHEIGHVLGLGHSEDPDALMYYDISRRTMLTLAQDDMDGINYLYPQHEPDNSIFGCGTVSSLPPQGPGSSGPFFNALGMFVFSLFAFGKLRKTKIQQLL